MASIDFDVKDFLDDLDDDDLMDEVEARELSLSRGARGEVKDKIEELEKLYKPEVNSRPWHLIQDILKVCDE